MKLCPKCEERYVCCDFCVYFDFNEDKQGHYTGDGYCKFHKIPQDPGHVCDDFHCEDLKLKPKKKNKK